MTKKYKVFKEIGVTDFVVGSAYLNSKDKRAFVQKGFCSKAKILMKFCWAKIRIKEKSRTFYQKKQRLFLFFKDLLIKSSRQFACKFRQAPTSHLEADGRTVATPLIWSFLCKRSFSGTTSSPFLRRFSTSREDFNDFFKVGKIFCAIIGIAKFTRRNLWTKK